MRASRFTWSLWHVMIILVPTALLWNLDARFYYDWQNHEWFVGYFGEYFRQHGTMPQVLNAAPIVGLPQPIFYGWLLFPALGFVSAVTGAAIALRLAILLTFAVQFCAVYIAALSQAAPRRAGPADGADRFQATVIAAIVTWAVYPLTNLYNRAALTEFFAVAFLTSAVGFMIAAVARRGPAAAGFTWLAGIFAILAVGSHPPTAVVGGGFLLLLVLTGGGVLLVTRRMRRDLLVSGLLVALLGLVVLGPWIYANLKLDDQIYILAKLRRFAFFPERTDSFVGRFMPIPYDAETLRTHGNLSTPYAEAQIAMAMLLLVVWQALAPWSSARGRSSDSDASTRSPRPTIRTVFLVVSAAWFVLTVALSLSPALAAHFQLLAPYVQFPSRFVSHANLALLVCVLLQVRAVDRGQARRRWAHAAVLALALALAATGVVLKLRHGAFVREIAPESRYAWQGDRAALVSAGRKDAATDYASVTALPQLTPAAAAHAQSIAFPVGISGSNFGRVGETEVSLSRAGWVVTNAVVFPWATVRVDGDEVPQARTAAVEHASAAYLPAGTHHLQWQWHPDPVWVRLRFAAVVAVVLLLVGLIVLTFAWSRTVSAHPYPGHSHR